MKIVEVAPITKGTFLEFLSYFSKEDPAIGSIVTVPLRSKKIKALVTKVSKTENLKAEIKNAPFLIKKANITPSRFIFPQNLVKALTKTAEYFATNLGATTFACISQDLFSFLEKNPEKNIYESKKNNKEKFVIQGDSDEIYSSYKILIRQKFAQKLSVFLVVPTSEDAFSVKEKLEKGIEDFTVILTSSLSDKKIKENLNKLTEKAHPLLIIGTANFIASPRTDIGIIILDKASSKSYKNQFRPFLDLKKFVEFYAEESGLTIFIGDLILPTEILHRHSKGEFLSGEPFKWRTLSQAKTEVVDMKKYKTEIEEFESGIKGKFRIISDETKKLIQRTRDENKKMFIFNVRKGLSPQTICLDCGEIVRCNTCGSPMVLYPSSKSPNRNFFMCQKCGGTKSSEELCSNCGSWRMQAQGIGLDAIEKEIKAGFKNISIFRLDKDSCPKESQVKDVISNFLKSPGSVLLGTEMALRYLHEKIEFSSIISIDPLFSIPDFKINEAIFYTISLIRNLTIEEFVIQTRKNDENIFDTSSKGNIVDFWRKEESERKNREYPPFSVLVKLTIRGHKESIVTVMKNIQEKLTPQDIDVFPSFTRTARGEYVLHGLLKVPSASWPDQKIISQLKSLPPSIEVNVDPESLI